MDLSSVLVRPMSQQDMTKHLRSILDLAMMANPWAARGKYKDYLLERFRMFPQLSLVAVHQHKIVGFVMGETTGKLGEVEDIAVLPQYRRRGIGRRLMRAELEKMRKTGVKRVTLWVHWKNSDAIPFYYTLRFRFLRVRLDREGPREDIVYLGRNID
jgi:[ribosomal protein S18]-alanine N-acetyltransferase